MNILAIYSVSSFSEDKTPIDRRTSIHLGLSYIIGILEKEGHHVKLEVLTTSSVIEDRISPILDNFNPDMVCFTAVSNQFQFVSKVARYIKKVSPKTYTILGGHHASLAPENAISEAAFDSICIGEGERAIVQLAKLIEQKRDVANINNLWVRKDDGVLKYPNEKFFDELDTLPFINREIWDPWIKNADRDTTQTILIGRGCPFRCTYCANHILKKLTDDGGSYVRLRSPKNLIEEISTVIDNYPNTTAIHLEFETFGANIKKSNIIFEALSEFNRDRQNKISFNLLFALTSKFMRNRDVALNFLNKMKAAGVKHVTVALESGNEKLRTEVLKRPPYTNNEFVEFSNLINDIGLSLYSFILIGFPGETLENHLETVQICKKAKLSSVLPGIFYPFQGTELADVAENKGYIDPKKLKKFEKYSWYHNPTLNMPKFSNNQIKWAFVLFSYRVTKGKKSTYKRILLLMRAWVFVHPKLHERLRPLKRYISID